MNRYDRHTGLSKDVIGTALHTDIFHIMPSDYEAIQKSLMEGKPLGPATSFGKSVIGAGGSPGRKLGGAQEKQFALRPAVAVFPHVVAGCALVRAIARSALRPAANPTLLG